MSAVDHVRLRRRRTPASPILKPPLPLAMTDSKPQPPPNGTIAGRTGHDPAGDAAPDSVDKIRDIIFGSQMRDYERKFTRLEERLLQEAATVREDLARGFAAIEALIKTEVATLNEAQAAERGVRGEALEGVTARLNDSVKGWEAEAARIADRHTRAQQDQRDLLLGETKRLSEEIERKHADQSRENQSLRAMLTDRFALADLLTDVASRLKDEPRPR